MTIKIPMAYSRLGPLPPPPCTIEFRRWTKRDRWSGFDLEGHSMTLFPCPMILPLSMRGRVTLNASGTSVQLPLTASPTMSQITPGILQLPGHPSMIQILLWTQMKIPTTRFWIKKSWRNQPRGCLHPKKWTWSAVLVRHFYLDDLVHN